jgi:predicted transcriptional regulator
MLNNRQIATALVAVSKLDKTNSVHMEAATGLVMEIASSLCNKIKNAPHLEIASEDSDVYVVEALTDVLDEVTDEITEVAFDPIENDTVGDTDEVEEALIDTASAQLKLKNVLNLLKQ